MILQIHAKAGALAFLTIICFWFSTVTAEAFGDQWTIATVKEVILWAFLILIPAIVTAAVTGRKMASGNPAARAKAKRMPFIAANGVLILVPAAVFLFMKARAGEFDTSFVVVQGLELLAGATNATLLFLNLRDGRALLHPTGVA